MNSGYLDCFSGVSGNMLLGALLDAGLAEDDLLKTLHALPVDGYELHIQQRRQQAITGCLVEVEVTGKQPHRHLAEITGIITESTLPDSIKKKSIGVFTRLAAAEARVHGTTVQQVHFHEVGAVDALIDIVGTVAGFELLHVGRIDCSPLPVSNGLTICEHGVVPLPAPAVCELLQGVPVYGLDLQQELVTPTGAALVRELVSDFGPMPPMTLAATGYGAGSTKRSDGCPNLLRLCLGHRHQVGEAAEVAIIETHLDDWNMETWPHISECLMAAGALDVSLCPIQMKKGRPGFELKLICRPDQSLALKQIILAETSAIGLRFHRQQRMTLPREAIDIPTPLGTIRGKKTVTDTGVKITPEYECCRRLARQHRLPIQHLYDVFYRSIDPACDSKNNPSATGDPGHG